jgi:hypothetical protein
MFELTRATATLAHFNARSEIHGEDKKPAADLKLTMTGNNELLALIDENLRRVLFAPKPAANADQLFEEDPPLTELRFPYLGTLKWARECVGRDVEIEWGIDDTSAIRLASCTVDHFVIDPEQGGAVQITFRVRCYPTAEDAGKLFELQQREVTITVEPASQTALDLDREAA